MYILIWVPENNVMKSLYNYEIYWGAFTTQFTLVIFAAGIYTWRLHSYPFGFFFSS